VRDAGGRYRWYNARGVPVLDADGTVREWVGVCIDIDDRRRAEAALAGSEARFRAIVEQVGAGIAQTDRQGRFFLVNDRYCTIVGRPREALLGGLRMQDITHPDDLAANLPAFERLVRDGTPFTIEKRYLRPDGTVLWVSNSVAPVRDAAGQVVAAVAVSQDVTARRAAEDDLRRLNETLEQLVETRTAALLREAEERRRAEEAARQAEKLAALGQLTGGVAHDFNNLLQVVTSGAALLKRTSVPEARKAEILEGMIKAGKNARDLTGRLLAFARQQALRPEVIDMKARIGSMSDLLRQTLGSRIRVETDIEPDLWPVRADASQLEVAILNLAVNARDAMPEGGTLTIQARNATLDATGERAAGEYVCIAVSDTGEGMPPHILSRVLEPFFTTKGPGKGTGLGLPQVYGFARQSGGDLRIDSEPGCGTVVSLHLPRAAAGADGAGTSLPDDRRSQALRGVGRTVLVVDDNADVAAFACTLLEEQGYATKRAGGAAEALAMLADGEPVDAVFSDVVLQGSISGVELAAALRSSHPRIAVVLTTGYSEQLARSGAPAGIETLAKPYHPDELAAALGRALARSRREVAAAG
jgi:PAS domain S-box-containing protein